jgi:hypothetical protein
MGIPHPVELIQPPWVSTLETSDETHAESEHALRVVAERMFQTESGAYVTGMLRARSRADARTGCEQEDGGCAGQRTPEDAKRGHMGEDGSAAASLNRPV